MALERGEDFSCFVVFALANQETWRIWQKRAEAPDTDGEEDLEGEWEAPSDIAWSKGEA